MQKGTDRACGREVQLRKWVRDGRREKIIRRKKGVRGRDQCLLFYLDGETVICWRKNDSSQLGEIESPQNVDNLSQLSNVINCIIACEFSTVCQTKTSNFKTLLWAVKRCDWIYFNNILLCKLKVEGTLDQMFLILMLLLPRCDETSSVRAACLTLGLTDPFIQTSEPHLLAAVIRLDCFLTDNSPANSLQIC